MAYLDEWKALSGRIRGLMQAGELHARFLSVNSSDSYNRAGKLREHCQSTLVALESYATTHNGKAPPSVLQRIRTFSNDHRVLITDVSGTRESLNERMHAALVLLGGLESELSFLLSDTEEMIRGLSERAFEHLQRSIVADPDIKAKWRNAFNLGEIYCEQLGGAHLLAHGIFAFKINAEGERTDLVFQDKVQNIGDKQRYADGLVLTEWKKAKVPEDANQKFVDGRKQAALYSKGILGGSELASYRYVVVVSEDRVTPLADIVDGAVTYRHINIAVNPRSPGA